MHRFTIKLAPALIALALCAPAASAQSSLDTSFMNPPDSARPHVWWHWLNGNVSKEGITADLEAFKKVGIGGGSIASLPFAPDGPAPFMTPAFRDMVKHAASEADRLGLELGIFNCEGWSSSGGPWITPPDAMQMVVWSNHRLHGPAAAGMKLPQPLTKLGYYRDAAVVAFPTPASEQASTLRDLHATVTGADGKTVDAAGMYDGDMTTAVTVPPAADGKSFLQFDLAQPFTASSLRFVPGPRWVRNDFELQASDDGQAFHTVHRFGMPGVDVDSSGTSWMTTGDFPAVTARSFRLVFDFRAPEAMTIAEFNLLPPAAAASTPINPQSIVNLTGKVDAAGSLAWDAPAGDWTILRVGYTPIGVHNHPSSKWGDGLECDKLSRTALDHHFAGMMDKVIADLGPLTKSLDYGLIDSYETGEQNWTPAMPQDFRQHSGYDMTEWLPALTGRTVGSADESSRFRDDFRRTITDLWTENYYGYFAQLLHQHGMKSHVEAYGNGLFDNLRSAGLNDMPMSEFWFGNSEDGNSAKQASSAAHTYGRPIVGAESFTSGDQFNFDPANMKIEGDWIYAHGVQRYFFHSSAGQMWTDDRKPGWVWGNGIHFTRNLTWWDESPAWLKYIARCQYMLQQGRFVADILSYEGENAYHFDGDPRPLKNPPPGYDYDGLDPQLLTSALTVTGGRLSLPSGMSYRILALPDDPIMSPTVLRHIRDLVQAGAVVFGPRPLHSFGLAGYPASDAEVKRLADELWGPIDGKTIMVHRLGRGRVYWTGAMNNLQPVLDDLKILPDFTYVAPDAQLLYLHRQIGGTDAYFVSNQETSRVNATCTFRAEGKAPELWDPETGAVRPAPVWQIEPGGRVSIPLDLEPAQSLFVVFRKPASRADHLVSVTRANPGDDPAPAHTLVIRHAVYVAQDGFGAPLDVTAKLAALVRNGALRAIASNTVFGSDPASLHVKQVRIDYTYDGKDGTLTLPENARIRIPADPGEERPVYAMALSPTGRDELTAWQPGAYTFTFKSGKVRREDVSGQPAPLPITGPWTVHFDPRWGGPAIVTFDQLQDWTARPEDGIKHYSGTATYENTFTAPADWVRAGRVVSLDLGQLQDLAEVTINGHDLGVVWKAPWRRDVTAVIQPGQNSLQVKVTNQWANRLIGDSALPADRRLATTTMNPYHPDSPLLSSGLLGPVTLQVAPVVEVK